MPVPLPLFTLRILTAEAPLEAALMVATEAALLPGVDVIAVPAGLDAERLNTLRGATEPPAAGTPVMAAMDLPDLGLPAGALGMVEAPERAGDGLRVVVDGTGRVVPWDGALFTPAHAVTYLRLQRQVRRFRHVVAVSGPSTDLRYLSVAARAATAAVTLAGTPDQLFRMAGPRDARGVPVSAEVKRVLRAAGHPALRVLNGAGEVVAERLETGP